MVCYCEVLVLGLPPFMGVSIPIVPFFQPQHPKEKPPIWDECWPGRWFWSMAWFRIHQDFHGFFIMLRRFDMGFSSLQGFQRPLLGAQRLGGAVPIVPRSLSQGDQCWQKDVTLGIWMIYSGLIVKYDLYKCVYIYIYMYIHRFIMIYHDLYYYL